MSKAQFGWVIEHGTLSLPGAPLYFSYHGPIWSFNSRDAARFATEADALKFLGANKDKHIVREHGWG